MIEINNKSENLSSFLMDLEDEQKSLIPLTVFHAQPTSSNYIKVAQSSYHNTEILACFLFYKPISRTFATFEDE